MPSSTTARTVKGIIAAALLAFVLGAGCARRREAVPRKAEPAPEAGVWNETARFLGGLKGPPGGAFRALEDTPAWRQYAADFDGNWKQLETSQFQPVEAFQKRELASLHTGSRYLFYPFSGPDVLYPLRFFPEGGALVMSGLEPVGNLRPREYYRTEKLERELHGWRQALSSIVERSFFVTSEMDQQFRGRVADGLLPMILLLLARSGHTIEQVRYGKLSGAGEFLPENPREPPVRKHAAVEVRFRRGPGTAPRTLYYFATNLGPAFEHDLSFARFLDRMGKPDTLVKSASFLLHWRMCQGLRRYILENSNLVLEDDTGVPYHYFQDAGWQVRLFGAYSRPDKPFQKLYQQDLAEAFRDSARVRPLGFSLGYGYGRRPSSMILAMRARPQDGPAGRQ